MKRPALALLAAAGLALTGCAAPKQEPAAASIKLTHEVTYEVEGKRLNKAYASIKGTGTVTFSTGTGTQQLETTWPLMNKGGTPGATYTMRTGDAAVLSAQAGYERASVTCRIKIDGVTVSENTSVGSYTIASCSAPVR